MTAIKKYAKRLLAVSICLTAAVSAAFAETHYKPHISVGVHGGMEMGRVSFSPSVEQGWVQGPTMGVSIRYAEERLVGIVAELNVATRGWAEKFEDSDLSYKRTLGYITLPVLTHIYFGSDRTKCFFNLGPQVCLLFSDKTSANFDIDKPQYDDRWPQEARMTAQLTMPVKNKFDYGICVGFGCEFWTSPRNSVYLEGRYYYGLGNIFPATKADTFGASRNMSLAVTLGYNFRLK